SSPVVPKDDPTLLFANAGMNQFKEIFLGLADPSSDFGRLKRAANSQKCIRAGGKHNDLEDVGKDTYHHTFFEMLGNWSFGDYFKAEAIAWAWELLTEVYRIPKDRLYATCFEGAPELGLEPDVEARELWLRFLPPSRVLPGGMKDNFWEMGETGPCGPCSEIHYDRVGGRDASQLVNSDDKDVIEIWNLVFIQFNRESDGVLRKLRARHVDTGMGLERLASILAGKTSNYDTDLFTPIFEAIRKETGAPPYGGKVGAEDEGGRDTAYRVIADHIRTLTFALTDGAMPGNEGRGYVLRRILRRAVRYGRQKLAARTGFFSRLAPVVAERMESYFPELRKAADRVAAVILEEEESFGRTLDRGLSLFEEAASAAGRTGTISGEDAFRLYDTYGFPIDLTALMAAERGLKVDMAAYEELMEGARRRSRAAGKAEAQALEINEEILSLLKGAGVPPTDDSAKYELAPIRAAICAIFVRGKLADSIAAGGEGLLIFDRTPFYAESGGQVADRGTIQTPAGRAEVLDVRKAGEYVAHRVRVIEGRLDRGTEAGLRVDTGLRLATQRNHTATHLLHLALRETLGQDAVQSGSLVDPDRLRLDFAFRSALSGEQIRAIEARGNELVYACAPVTTKLTTLEEARREGAMALFGEKYGSMVRVVCAGPSRELCGGTHVSNTGQIGYFRILSEEAIAAGVRRIEAATGTRAVADGRAAEDVLARLQEMLRARRDEIPDRVAAILAERDKASKEMARARAAAARARVADRISEARDENGVKVLALDLGEAAADDLKAALNSLKTGMGEGVIILAGRDGGKANILAYCSPECVRSGIKAGDIVKISAGAIGGGGGGRPELAQAGGRNPEGIPDAIEAARRAVREMAGRR
ncbi:MAG: alanine--tRNA ligase, partial [Planctomycetota bacterium]|nr:alanine--tRNA ligase [Planctomycetota bacterium]